MAFHITGVMPSSRAARSTQGRRAPNGGRNRVTGFARDLLQSVFGSGEFVQDSMGRGERQVGMAPGVIADDVAGIDDGAGNRGLLGGETAHEKEGCANAVTREDFEETRRPGGIGAVVEGEGQFAGARGRNERSAEDLRGRPA